MSHKTSNKKQPSTLRDNLNQLMHEAKVSMSQLHRNTGVPIPNIQRMRNDYSANPTISSLKPIADFFSISINQLIGDEPLPQHMPVGYRENQQHWTSIPVISWEEATTWPTPSHEGSRRIVSTDMDVSKQAYCLEVEEENWTNLAPGTLLIVEPKISYKHRDFVVVCKKGDEQATLKQLLIDEGVQYLKPLVVDYPMVIKGNKHKLLGVVVEYKKELRK